MIRNPFLFRGFQGDNNKIKKNPQSYRKVQTKAMLQMVVGGSVGSSRFVNDQSLPGNESHTTIALRNGMFWK